MNQLIVQAFILKPYKMPLQFLHSSSFLVVTLSATTYSLLLFNDPNAAIIITGNVIKNKLGT